MKVTRICRIALLSVTALVTSGSAVPGQTAQGFGPADYDCPEPTVRYSEYKVIVADSTSELSSKVTDAVTGGWEPVGGVAFDGQKYLQALADK